jgi:chemotaxis family two-component system response regulator Rcp1
MNTQTKSVQPVELLLVEDNDDDVVLTREGFRATRLSINLNRVENGEQCMAFLRKQPPFENAPTVALVLLDINMPRMDGREVMAAINADATLRHLPVVVLTTSAAKTDILQMYALRCSSYIVKPVIFEEFIQAITKLEDYWWAVVALPTGQDPEGT